MSAFPVQSCVPISVSNHSPAPDDQVWIAVFGTLIANPGGGQQPVTGASYYLDATAQDNNQVVPQLAAAVLPSGPGTADNVILPSFTLAQWGSNLSMPIPAYTSGSAQQFSGRVILSVGAPVQAQVNADGSVSAPSSSKGADPSTGTFYDFLEFTVASNADDSNNVDFDTSQVDAFGLPVQLQFFKDAAGTQTYNISFTGDTTSGSTQLQNLSPTSGLGTGMPLSGEGIAGSSLIVAIPAGANPASLTLNQPATATASAVALTVSPAGPVGVVATRAQIFGGDTTICFADFIQTQVNAGNANAKPFVECAAAAPLRLIAPKDVCEAQASAASTDPLNNYFNAQVDAFFLKYFTGSIGNSQGGGDTFSLQSGASGNMLTYSGTVQLLNGNYVLSLTETTGVDKTAYTIYYPFFSSNLPAAATYVPVFPAAAAPSWIVANQMQFESASQMIFACDAVFADNTGRGFDTIPEAVLGDLEDSISAAFNRGIILNDPANWDDTSQWFPANGLYNYWVQYWHQNGLAANGLAYAFPYDDKFGSSSNMQQSSLGQIAISLGSWGSLPLPVISFSNLPISAQQGGAIALTATAASNTGGGAVPTGSITFFVDGYPLNPAGYANGPQAYPVSISNGQASLDNASLPPLPDGAHTHTYTVTAVYSGDSNYQPALAYGDLQLTGPNGDFAVMPTPAQFAVGAAINVQVNLPVAAPSGSLVVNLLDSLGNIVSSTASQSVSTSVNTVPFSIPADTLSFTGDATSGNAVIANASSISNLTPGQGLSGTCIAPGTTVSQFDSNSVTMSLAANASATATTIISDATLVTYSLQAVYTPASGSVLTGSYNFAFVAGS